MLLSRVQRTIVEQGLLARGDRVLVGLSGGPDSWALLLCLQRLAPRLGIEVSAACVDHGLRPESAREARAVAAACRQRGVPCQVIAVDVAARRGRGISLQDAARRARLDALEARARKRRMKVALGHNADDQAETILFRIVRGTGVAGLAGIPFERGVFVRPLLEVPRAEIERFVRRHGVEPVCDPSNQDRRFTRARIRQEWMPLLARENPRIAEALCALGRDAGRVLRQEPPHATASVPSHLHRRTAAALRSLAERARGTRRLSVPGGEVEVRYGEVSFHPRAAAAPSEKAKAAELSIEGEGVYFLPGTLAPVRLAVRTRAAAVSDGPDRASFDAAAVVWPLRLRTWQAGDRMHPRGGPGRRKLQDLFTDAKIPRPLRGCIPVVLDGAGMVLWVAGFRPSEIGRPSEETRRWLDLWWEPQKRAG